MVRDGDGDKGVCIGARADSTTGEPALWWHVDGAWGAAEVRDPAAWRANAKVSGRACAYSS